MFTATQAREAIAQVSRMMTFEDLNDYAAEIEMERSVRDRWYRLYTAATKLSQKIERRERFMAAIQTHIAASSYNED